MRADFTSAVTDPDQGGKPQAGLTDKDKQAAPPRNDSNEFGSESLTSLPADRKLGTSESLFRLAFERSSVGLAVLDAQGCWVLFNQAFCDIFDKSPAQAPSHQPARFGSPRTPGRPPSRSELG